jgi:hypothetical protein
MMVPLDFDWTQCKFVALGGICQRKYEKFAGFKIPPLPLVNRHSQKPATRNPQLTPRNGYLATSSRRPAASDQTPPASSQTPEANSQKTEPGNRNLEL